MELLLRTCVEDVRREIARRSLFAGVVGGGVGGAIVVVIVFIC